MTHQLSSRAESSTMSDLEVETKLQAFCLLNIKSEDQWRGGEIARRCWPQKNSDCYIYWSFLFVSWHNKMRNIANTKIKRWLFLLSKICNQDCNQWYIKANHYYYLC